MTTAAETRWEIACTLCERLESLATLADVPVDPAFPGNKHMPAEMVWIGELDGNINVPTSMTTGRHQRDDDFDLPIRVRVAGVVDTDHRASLRSTGDRLAELVAAIENYLADDITLGGHPAVSEAQVTTLTSEVVSTPESPIGWAQMLVSVRTRLL